MQAPSIQRLFQPHSVAVIGASDRPESRGFFVWQAVSRSRGARAVWPVNPKYRFLGDSPCHARIRDLPAPPDLAVLTLRNDLVLPALRELGRIGTPWAVIAPEEEHLFLEGELSEAIAETAREVGIRVIGPDSIGLLSPLTGLNASYWPLLPNAGGIALITQSALIATALIDDAAETGTGFSYVVNTGTEVDLSAAELLEYLSRDPATRVIALQIEGLRHPRNFYGALRQAARRKPVVILRPGSEKGFSSDRLATYRFGTHSGRGVVFEALARRAGAQCVTDFNEFSSAVTALASCRTPYLRDDALETRIGVISNGSGFALMTASETERRGLRLQGFSTSTSRALRHAFPSSPLPTNPIVTGAAASGEQLSRTLDIVLSDPMIDGVVVTVAPGPSTPVDPTFRLLAQTTLATTKPVAVAWASERISQAVRVQLAHVPQARLAAIRSPTAAVAALSFLIGEAHLKREARTPPRFRTERLREESLLSVRRLAEEVLRRGDVAFRSEETERFLAAARLPPLREGASDAGLPLRFKLARDDVLGPYVSFGIGGAFEAVYADEQAALPPLGVDGALRTVRSTRVGQTLGEAAALSAARILARLAELAECLPALTEVLLDLSGAETGASFTTNAAVRVAELPLKSEPAHPHLTIRPADRTLTPIITHTGERYLLRTLLEEDFEAMRRFVGALSDKSFFLRFHSSARLSDERTADLCRIDYERDDAVVVQTVPAEGNSEFAAVGRWNRTDLPDEAEFGVVVGDAHQRRGLARTVMHELERRARKSGIRRLVGYVLKGNDAMDGLMRNLGYVPESANGRDTVPWVLELSEAAENNLIR